MVWEGGFGARILYADVIFQPNTVHKEFEGGGGGSGFRGGGLRSNFGGHFFMFMYFFSGLDCVVSNRECGQSEGTLARRISL